MTKSIEINTTNFEKVEKDWLGGLEYIWGKIVKIHKIGDFAIIEYVPNHEKNNSNEFHVYVSGEDTHTSTESLDEALVEAITHKYGGPGSSAAHYFLKMIDFSIQK